MERSALALSLPCISGTWSTRIEVAACRWTQCLSAYITVMAAAIPLAKLCEVLLKPAMLVRLRRP